MIGAEAGAFSGDLLAAFLGAVKDDPVPGIREVSRAEKKRDFMTAQRSNLDMVSG